MHRHDEAVGIHLRPIDTAAVSVALLVFLHIYMQALIYILMYLVFLSFGLNPLEGGTNVTAKLFFIVT